MSRFLNSHQLLDKSSRIRVTPEWIVPPVVGEIIWCGACMVLLILESDYCPLSLGQRCLVPEKKTGLKVLLGGHQDLHRFHQEMITRGLL